MGDTPESRVRVKEGDSMGEVGRPDINTERVDLHEILRKHNTSVDEIVGKLLPGLDAVRYDSDGDETTTPDWNARTKIGTLIMTALGYMKQSSVEVNVEMTAEEKEVEELFKFTRGISNG